MLATVSYAQSDMDQVKAAVSAYHEALSTLDAPKIESSWAHDSGVMDIEPASKAIVLGWEGVKKNIEAYFEVFSELKLTQADGPHIQVKGDVAWSTGIVTSVSKRKDGTAASRSIFETDVFEKRGGAWLLVSHTALAMPQ
jgi:ketosteroid isomerase-like protein